MPTHRDLPDDWQERSRRHAQRVEIATERARLIRQGWADPPLHPPPPSRPSAPASAPAPPPDGAIAPAWLRQPLDRQDVLTIVLGAAVALAVLLHFS